MDMSLILWMIVAAFAAVMIYTFIGFIPGTDETSVLLPITLAIVLAGVPAQIVLTFFIAAIVTLNLTNSMPTALVGLPGGVMSSPMIEHAIEIKSRGKSANIIKKMAAASFMGVLISLPISLALAFFITPFAEAIRPYAGYLFVIGAVFLSLISKNKVLSLLSILPLALLFQSLRHLYWGLEIVEPTKNITVSFFLGITVGPLLVSLFQLLNKQFFQTQVKEGVKEITIPAAEKEKTTLNPFKILTKEERRSASLGALLVNFFFVLSPVGLTILVGNTVGNKQKEREKKATLSITTMSAVVQATYLSGIIIPLLALGIPLSPVAVGPGNALFTAPPVFSLDNNIHHLLDFGQFGLSVLIGALVALSISYVLINRYATKITSFILKRIPHESVLGLFIAFIFLLAYMDAGLINIFGVLLIGLLSGSLNKMGVNYGVQFMSLYAAPMIVGFLIGSF